MRFRVTDKKDLELIKELEEASSKTQEAVAINLAKIGRWDIINAAQTSSLLERLQNNPEWQKVALDQMNKEGVSC